MNIWQTTCEMAPYLLLGFLISGFLSALVSPDIVERHLGGHGFWPVFKASLVGVPLPLCSCGVIPVAASLRRHGSSKGATAAFLISTPQTGVDSIAVTYGMLGPVFAIFRPLAAFVSGLVGGWIIEAADDKEIKRPANQACADECCTPSRKKNSLWRTLYYSFVVLPRDISRPLIVGLLVAGVIGALVPQGFFSDKIGSDFLQMLIMMAFGIPLYVCATASVPIAATMIMKGISPGAALVFLMTGPATNAATIATIWKTMGRRTALIYLGVVAGTALASGILLDNFFVLDEVSAAHLTHEMLPAWFQTACAVAVLIMLAVSFIKPVHKHSQDHADKEGIENVELKIKGMTCSRCCNIVQHTLAEFPSVTSAEVSLLTGTALITGIKYDITAIIKAIEELGYKVEKK
jgi:uncharacterized protein